jgi:MinD-like ATPase involved in chromosome partitioning or flagellar assembly
MSESYEPTDTSDRLYTPEELAVYAKQQAAGTAGPQAQEAREAREASAAPETAPEPIRGDPLTDPIPGWPSSAPIAPPPGPPAPVAAPVAAPTADPIAAPTGPPPSGPPPVAAPAAPPAPPAAPPSAPPTGPPSAPPQAPPQVAPPASTQAQPQGPRAAQHPSAVPTPADPAGDVRRFMTATDFLDRRDSDQQLGPATWGWRGRVRRWSGNLIKPQMGRKEETYEHHRAAIQRDFDGPRTIAFINPKGGAAKTTGVLAAGYTFGTVRGGGVVAWDNNETRGTLGIRGTRSSHRNTTRELLEDLGRFKDVYQSRIGDLGAFVRSQGDAHFDVLASDERPDVTGTIRAEDFKEVHSLLERFYRIILVDTGNNMRAENWLASAEAADLLVVTSTVREDTGYSGLWMLDALQDAGLQDLKHKCVTVLSDPSPKVDDKLAADLVAVYEQRTRGVYRVPYDPSLVAGSVVPYAQLSDHTRMSWLAACAGMASAL